MGNFRNRYSTDTWKEDSWASVDFYNNWFLTNAPLAYQTARKGVLEKVKDALKKAGYLKSVSTDTILANPEITTILRACTPLL